jgi:hypothetical protein
MSVQVAESSQTAEAASSVWRGRTVKVRSGGVIVSGFHLFRLMSVQLDVVLS